MSKRNAATTVDCTNGKRGLWLVKVPRYLSEQWQQCKADGSEIGRLVVANSKEVTFKSSPNVIAQQRGQSTDLESFLSPASSSSVPPIQPIVSKQIVKQKPVSIPEEHRFVIGSTGRQTLAVISEDRSELGAERELMSGKVSVEGRVVQKAECRPPNTLEYMQMKIKHIEKSVQPKRHIQQIDKAEVKFKPVAIHAEAAAREKAKKEGIKTFRLEKDAVLDILFKAFEKHQFYRLVDLQKVTQQPPGYLKEILNDIAIYNTAPPHRAMWELKPEYRHYKEERDEKKT